MNTMIKIVKCDYASTTVWKNFIGQSNERPVRVATLYPHDIVVCVLEQNKLTNSHSLCILSCGIVGWVPSFIFED